MQPSLPNNLYSIAFSILLGISAATNAARADETGTILHQGIERHYIVYSPTSVVAAPSPTVIALQGNRQTIGQLRETLRMDRVADRDGFHVVYPRAVKDSWSYGRPVHNPMSTVNGEPADDVGFIDKLIDRLIDENISDPGRIYVTGVSRGGIMAFTLACTIPRKIAAIGPIIANMTEHQISDCNSNRPLPVVVVAGTSDFNVRYDGWIHLRGRLLSVPETMEYWRKRNGCKRQSVRLIPNRAPHDRTRIARHDWTECSSGAPTILYRVANGGHRVPTLEPQEPGPPGRSGRRSGDMETAEEFWSIFKTIRRR